MRVAHEHRVNSGASFGGTDVVCVPRPKTNVSNASSMQEAGHGWRTQKTSSVKVGQALGQVLLKFT